jgi:hypothetical protein
MGNHELTARIEVGPAASRRSPVPARSGRFENTLLELERDAGTEIVDGASRRIRLGGGIAEVSFTTFATGPAAPGSSPLDRRASGRANCCAASSVGRPVSHAANACWFRFLLGGVGRSDDILGARPPRGDG